MTQTKRCGRSAQFPHDIHKRLDCPQRLPYTLSSLTVATIRQYSSAVKVKKYIHAQQRYPHPLRFRYIDVNPQQLCNGYRYHRKSNWMTKYRTTGVAKTTVVPENLYSFVIYNFPSMCTSMKLDCNSKQHAL